MFQGTIDVDRLVALVQEVCRIPSVLGEEGAVARYLASVMKDSGFEGAGLQEVLPDRPNAVGELDFGAGPRVVFTGHIDTKPVSHGWTRLEPRRHFAEARFGLPWAIAGTTDADAFRAAGDRPRVNGFARTSRDGLNRVAPCKVRYQSSATHSADASLPRPCPARRPRTPDYRGGARRAAAALPHGVTVVGADGRASVRALRALYFLRPQLNIGVRRTYPT